MIWSWATIALDAPWGAGKTVFLKQLAGKLRNEGWIVAYYDAFAEDYEADAFLPLASALVDALPDAAEQTRKNLIQSAMPIVKRVLGTGLRVGAKVLAAGILDTKYLGDRLEEALAEESESATALIAERLQASSAKRAEVQALLEAIDQVAELPDKEASKDAQVLGIIDELDRCRPEFAVQTLERVKHLFERANCKFLFGVNQPELAAVVKGHYGEGFSGRQYLQRFFELEFGFPTFRRTTAASIHLRALSTENEDHEGLTH